MKTRRTLHLCISGLMFFSVSTPLWQPRPVYAATQDAYNFIQKTIFPRFVKFRTEFLESKKPERWSTGTQSLNQIKKDFHTFFSSDNHKQWDQKSVYFKDLAGYTDLYIKVHLLYSEAGLKQFKENMAHVFDPRSTLNKEAQIQLIKETLDIFAKTRETAFQGMKEIDWLKTLKIAQYVVDVEKNYNAKLKPIYDELTHGSEPSELERKLEELEKKPVSLLDLTPPSEYNDPDKEILMNNIASIQTHLQYQDYDKAYKDILELYPAQGTSQSELNASTPFFLKQNKDKYPDLYKQFYFAHLQTIDGLLSRLPYKTALKEGQPDLVKQSQTLMEKYTAEIKENSEGLQYLQSRLDVYDSKRKAEEIEKSLMEQIRKLSQSQSPDMQRKLIELRFALLVLFQRRRQEILPQKLDH